MGQEIFAFPRSAVDLNGPASAARGKIAIFDSNGTARPLF
jgi:hypothetical protein